MAVKHSERIATDMNRRRSEDMETHMCVEVECVVIYVGWHIVAVTYINTRDY